MTGRVVSQQLEDCWLICLWILDWAVWSSQPMTIAAGMEILSTGILEAIITLWDAIIHATVGWLILGPLAIYVTYRLLIPLLERASQSLRKADEL